MKLELKRLYYRDTYTIGKLYSDGQYVCDTLEDIPREVKIKHETCIPKGTYKVILSMSNRFKKIMPEILNVPGFTGIRVHSGNTEEDTSGCVLVGKNKIKGKVINSHIAFEKLMNLLWGEAEIEITI